MYKKYVAWRYDNLNIVSQTSLKIHHMVSSNKLTLFNDYSDYFRTRVQNDLSRR